MTAPAQRRARTPRARTAAPAPTKRTPTEPPTAAPAAVLDHDEVMRRIGEWPAHARERYYNLSLAEVFDSLEALRDSIASLTRYCPAQHAADPAQHAQAMAQLCRLRVRLTREEARLRDVVPPEVVALVDAERADLVDRPAPTPPARLAV